MRTLSVPKDSIKRLFLYYRALVECSQEESISSEELGELTGFNAALIRKDFTYFGQFGIPAKGYNIASLRVQIAKILGIDRQWKIALIGVGHLGNALLRYPGFTNQNFRITEAFDSNPRTIGKDYAGIKVRDIANLPVVLKTCNIKIALIAVPAEAAQSVADLLADAGIKAIINFAPVRLEATDKIRILNIDITNELARLSYYLIQEVEPEPELDVSASSVVSQEPALAWV